MNVNREKNNIVKRGMVLEDKSHIRHMTVFGFTVKKSYIYYQ